MVFTSFCSELKIRSFAKMGYTKLCLEGGGVTNFRLLGALHLIGSTISIRAINEFAGTSAGAATCLLLAVGYTPDEIAARMITNSKIWNQLRYPDGMALLSGEGAFPFTPLQEFLESLLLEKIATLPTLGSLKKDFGKTLYCMTYNITSEESVMLGPDTHPDLPCIVAVRMSASIPFVFSPYVYRGESYVDGAVGINFPINAWDGDGSEILGICTHVSKTKTRNYSVGKPFEVFYLAEKIMGCMYRETQKLRSQIRAWPKDVTIITLDQCDVRPWDFSIQTKTKLDLFSQGYRAAERSFLTGGYANTGEIEPSSSNTGEEERTDTTPRLSPPPSGWEDEVSS